MAIEWNSESIKEVYLKMEMALVVKLVLQKIENKKGLSLEEILSLDIDDRDEVTGAIRNIYKLVEKLFYQEDMLYDYEENQEDPRTELEFFEMSVPYGREIRNISGLKMDVMYFELDDFSQIINNEESMTIVSNIGLYVDEECMPHKRYVKLEFTDEVVDIINSLDEIKDKKSIIGLISRMYCVDWCAVNISKDKVEVYGEYDLDMLSYNVSGSSEIYLAQGIAYDVIVLNVIQEYIKKMVSK